MNKINVPPIPQFNRRLVCVPDKSITHRAIMFNAVASGKSEVKGILLGEDCLSTVDCMRKLGAQIDIQGDTAYITGAKALKSANLYAGNSGTTMRLLCGLLACRTGEWKLTGDESLSRRPMRRVTDPLSEMGANFQTVDGKAPITVTGAKLHGINYTMPVASAQVKSAILLAALGAEGTTCVTEKERTRDHTEILLRHMGVDVQQAGNIIRIAGGQTPQAVSVTVAGDISSAAFPLVCGLITGGEITVANVGLNPTRTGLIEVFEQIGADFSVSNVRNSGGEQVGDITVRGLGEGKPFTIDGGMIPRLVDEIPVLAVLACYLGGDSVITDAQELRVKESDRIAATLRLLHAFGGKAQETESGMTISGVGRLKGDCTFDPAGDHRMAMAAAVAAAGSSKGAQICGSDCVAVSYPDFWDMLLGK